MPNKYPEKKGWNVQKQQFKVTNWSEYNDSLRRRGEWHQEKYELSSKASWRKLHLAINQDHDIEACILTDRFSHDDQQVRPLLEQIDKPIDHFSGDGAYDETPIIGHASKPSICLNFVKEDTAEG